MSALTPEQPVKAPGQVQPAPGPQKPVLPRRIEPEDVRVGMVVDIIDRARIRRVDDQRAWISDDEYTMLRRDGRSLWLVEDAPADAEFIAASRDDIPHLLALVESLTAERDALTETAAEALASYGLANSKHHAELERADRLERLADTLAGKAVDLEDRARLAEAEVERLRAVVERVEALADKRDRMGGFTPNVDLRAALAEPTGPDDLVRCDCGRAVPCRHCEPTGQEGDQ